MGKINLSDEDLTILSECINNQTEIPEELLLKLSPGFFEKLRKAGQFDYKELDKYKIPTIEYAGKRPESVILAQAAITGGAAPLQVIRSFGDTRNGEWKNLIVQGDNLQFLKTCYLNQDPLIKGKVKGKVKLICIDPPFATKSDFQSSEGAQSYADKIDRAEFIEALRERLIYMKQLLSEDGGIYVHLDEKMSHYIKVILDEVFGKENFINEIVWRYRRWPAKSKCFQKMHDIIFWYSKSVSANLYWKQLYEELSDSSKKQWKGKKRTDVKSDTGTRHSEIGEEDSAGVPMSDVWEISQITAPFGEFINFPTQKPESLLERFILSTTRKNDLVMDTFAGSGTLAAVAEKLGRRWIMCDFGKHAIYTMQKRILNIADSKKLGTDVKNNEKYGMPPKPFSIVSAGAYDFSRIMNLRQHKDAYISFVLGLFSIMRDEIDYSKKYKLPNIYAEKDNNPVEIYPVWDDEYLKEVRIDEDYLQGIIEASGGKLKGNYYIVVPETCTIITDITLKNSNKEDVNFKLLKFPYKVLEDFSRQFHIAEQPSSQDDINKLISSAGFYFNEEVKIKVEKAKGGFRIVEFDTGILDKNRERFKGLDGLAIVLIDKNYDGKVFSMDIAIYKKEIGDEGIVKIEGLTDKSYLIAIDKHGNESKIIKI